VSGCGRPAGELRWAIKDSLQRYLIAAGAEVSVANGCRYSHEGEFVFPAAEPGARSGAGRIRGDAAPSARRFTGDIRFLAHHGMLDVFLADPLLDAGPGTARLRVRLSPASQARTAIALVEWGASDAAADGRLRRVLAATLTADGARVFGGGYAAGTPLAPITLLEAAAHDG